MVVKAFTIINFYEVIKTIFKSWKKKKKYYIIYLIIVGGLYDR